MPASTQPSAAHIRLTRAAGPLAAPAWAVELAGDPVSSSGVEGPHGLRIALHRSATPEATLVTARAPDADRLPADAFRDLVTDIYNAVRRTLAAGIASHPVRVWNFVSAIHAPAGAGLDRYMIFNQGRHAAFAPWFGRDRFARAVPTASAVGHDGHDLVVHTLALRSAGTPVENPRQRPAYRYSTRYGPVAPCFARGTIVRIGGSGLRLLLGGTASIRGEDTVHAHDLDRQLAETFDNIASLISTARIHDPPSDPLATLTEARVYVASDTDIASVHAAVARRLAPSCRIELVRASICRAELLVEIEGVANLGDRP